MDKVYGLLLNKCIEEITPLDQSIIIASLVNQSPSENKGLRIVTKLTKNPEIVFQTQNRQLVAQSPEWEINFESGGGIGGGPYSPTEGIGVYYISFPMIMPGENVAYPIVGKERNPHSSTSPDVPYISLYRITSVSGYDWYATSLVNIFEPSDE